MGTVAEFIKRIKQREGFKFDGQVAEILDVDSRQLATYKSRNSLPNKYQEWYCSKYDVKLKDFHEDIEIVNKNINIEKEDSVMDARYIIDLQKEKIEHQQAEINRLNNIVHKQKETKNKPAFHFKTKVVFDPKTKMFGKNKVTGDTSMTGYTREFLSNLKNEEWSAMYHPESLQQLMSSIPDEVPDHTHNKWKNILWKAKNGTYRVYNIESYHDKKEGIVRAYYYWVNGDIEGQS